MSFEWTRRTILTAGIAAVPAFVLAADEAKPAVRGAISHETLAKLLAALGLESKLTEKRYDFEFKTVVEGEEWDLSMSTVLSTDSESIWVMAWLDELPKSAAEVPRSALVRLLSDNDKLGKGKFFAYVAANRRFVMQRVIPNMDITTKGFRAVLDDLGNSVAVTYSDWAVANWKISTEPADAGEEAGTPIQGSAPAKTTQSGGATQR